MANNYGGRSEPELALWMLERMRDSKEFLGVIQAARLSGRADILDAPEYVAHHKSRLKKLYQGDDEEIIDAPPVLAAKIEAIMRRDMISSVEELFEKALAAYLVRHPDKSVGLPEDWQTTFDLARAEIEGRTSGAFEPGFVAGLAASAREELDRQAAVESSLDAERDGRNN